jgi:hypothetical protein
MIMGELLVSTAIYKFLFTIPLICLCQFSNWCLKAVNICKPLLMQTHIDSPMETFEKSSQNLENICWSQIYGLFAQFNNLARKQVNCFPRHFKPRCCAQYNINYPRKILRIHIFTINYWMRVAAVFIFIYFIWKKSSALVIRVIFILIMQNWLHGFIFISPSMPLTGLSLEMYIFHFEAISLSTHISGS